MKKSFLSLLFLSLPLLASVPQLNAPRNDSMNTPINIVLRWTPEDVTAGTFVYACELQVCTDSTFKKPLHDTTVQAFFNGTNIICEIDSLAYLTFYYWRVREIDTGAGITDTGTWTSARAFKTIMPQAILPVQCLPESASVTTNNTITFVWNKVPASYYEGYTIEISTSPTFKPRGNFDTLLSPTKSSDTFVVVTKLNPGTYYWRIDGGNSISTTVWSPTWSFTITKTKTVAPLKLSSRISQQSTSIIVNVLGQRVAKQLTNKALIYKMTNVVRLETTCK
jgi:hypothetical protein